MLVNLTILVAKNGKRLEPCLTSQKRLTHNGIKNVVDVVANYYVDCAPVDSNAQCGGVL